MSAVGVVYDSSDLPSYLQAYTLDLGVLMDPFFTTAQDDAGYQRFWIIDPALDSAWSQFVAASAGESVRWAVLGADNAGTTAPGERRIYTTVTQGTEARFFAPTGVLTNQQLQFALTGTAAYIEAVNNTGGHNVPGDPTNQLPASWAQNGSSYTTPQDGLGFFGKVITDNFEGAPTGTAYSVTNELGKSSWFYYVTRSSATAIAAVRLDEFDNLGADGYFGFAKETGTNRYLLSYTLPAFVSSRETTLGVTFSNSFAHLAGVLSVSSVAGKGDSVLSLTEGFLRGLASASKAAGSTSQALSVTASMTAVSAVPEPSSWALMGAGAALLAGLRWRRARA